MSALAVVDIFHTRAIGVAYILVAISLEALGQISFKRVANAGGKGDTPESRLWRIGWVSFGVGCYVIEALFWTLALARLDISAAYPLGSLSFVAIALLSRLWLKEAVGVRRWIGIGLIVAGTVVVGGN